jgi:hypothetical protein
MGADVRSIAMMRACLVCKLKRARTAGPRRPVFAETPATIMAGFDDRAAVWRNARAGHRLSGAREGLLAWMVAKPSFLNRGW